MIKWRNRLWLTGVVSGLLCLLGAWHNRDQFFISYLFAYQFWFGIAASCLGLIMLHALTGGAWGEIIHPLLVSGMRTLPFLAFLFLPFIFGLHSLYPWSRPSEMAQDALLQHKQIYLNVHFFWLRTAGYFLLWSWMAWRLERWIHRNARERMAHHSGPGLILYLLSMTFALVDWMMSLEPHWSSTIYEPMVIIGQVLATLAFLICALAFISPRGLLRRVKSPEQVKPFWDLGNLLLAFVMFWAYLEFSQYLIIWSGNLPDEIAWYLHRQGGGWFWVAMGLIVFQFALPFAALLSRTNKQSLDRLAWIALLILGVHLVDVFWLVQPAFFPGTFHVHWLDGAAPLCVGALWLAAFLTHLQRQPVPVGNYEPV
jgi:hypothetical protein